MGIKGGEILTDEQIGKVSIVGAGMRSHPGVAAKVFKVLGDAGINIHMISTSPIKISCVIAADQVADAVRALHDAFELGADAIQQRAADRHPSPAPGGRRELPGRGARGDRRGRLDDPRDPRRAQLPRLRTRSVRLRALGGQAGSLRRRRGRLCRALSDETIEGIDIVISSAGGAVSSEWAPKLVEAGAVVVDNTSYWRMHDDVPLVVSEVNPDDIASHRGLIANPNCSTMQMVVALKPILDAAGIERLVISTYQSVSGTGQRAIEELTAQSQAALAGETAPAEVYPHQIAFNVVPQVETFKEGDDYTTEERKMMAETRKILGAAEADLGISATCARVPVFNAHSESVNVQTRDDLSPERVPRAARGGSRPDRASTIPAGASTRSRPKPRARTRYSSGGSAAILRTSVASTSGSSATTCARVPRPTPFRSPSCSSSATSCAFPRSRSPPDRRDRHVVSTLSRGGAL